MPGVHPQSTKEDLTAAVTRHWNMVVRVDRVLQALHHHSLLFPGGSPFTFWNLSVRRMSARNRSCRTLCVCAIGPTREIYPHPLKCLRRLLGRERTILCGGGTPRMDKGSHTSPHATMYFRTAYFSSCIQPSTQCEAGVACRVCRPDDVKISSLSSFRSR